MTVDIENCLKRLITPDYKGCVDKTEALKQLISPLLEVLILCEVNCWAGSPESQEVSELLKKYGEFDLTGYVRNHEEVEKELRLKYPNSVSGATGPVGPSCLSHAVLDTPCWCGFQNCEHRLPDCWCGFHNCNHLRN